MEYTEIQYETQDHGEIARIRLNRPQRLNATNATMYREIIDAIQRINHDNLVRVVILSGNGRAFCTGGDMKRSTKEGAHSGNDLISFIKSHKKAWAEHLKVCRVPIIAQVHGYALADGLDLMYQCDLIIAAEGTKIGLGGYFGDGPAHPAGSMFFGMPLRKFNETAFTGRDFSVDELCSMGVINKVVPLERLEEEATAMAKDIANINPLIIRLQKEGTNQLLAIMGAYLAKRDGQLVHVIGDYAAGLWGEETSAKRRQLGVQWFNAAKRVGGVFRDVETRDRVIEESFKELNRQGGTFTDMESLERVIKEAIEAVKSNPNWKGPAVR
jgi:naphthoate synthase